ncbi:hypothetical protein [Neobacillus novalis]|uniref:hypothetical protein n=1 Tax=Neobacillus novalis TaxID=220687 RepID=UPI001F40B5BA|nr:hypothetical protein [Neobacillus novalis]
MAKAFVLESFCSPKAVDFKGRPIKNLFIEEITAVHRRIVSILFFKKIPENNS